MPDPLLHTLGPLKTSLKGIALIYEHITMFVSTGVALLLCGVACIAIAMHCSARMEQLALEHRMRSAAKQDTRG